MARRINPRRIKIHFNYTVDEAARVLGTHKNTVRAWLRLGLPVLDSRRPTLILGRDLRLFLEQRRQRGRQTCGAGRIFCIRCRAPKEPAGWMADYLPRTPTSGNLRGICPDCNGLIHRAVSLPKIEEVRGRMDIMFPHALRHIAE